MKKKLHLCSLCGAEPLILKDKDFYVTKCSNNSCENSVYKTYDDKDAAVKDWNSRNPVQEGNENGKE